MTTPETKTDHTRNVAVFYSMMIALGAVAAAAAMVFIKGEDRFYFWTLLVIEFFLLLGLVGLLQQHRRQNRAAQHPRA